MHSTITTTATMLVSPNKPPSKPAADRDSSSLPSSACAERRCTFSTPPPFEDSHDQPSFGKIRRPMMLSPPPPPKRCKDYVAPSGGHDCVNSSSCSSVPEQPETPVSAKSVLIELNSGHLILNSSKSADAPPPRLVAPPSVPSQEPPEEYFSVGSITRANGPILSFDDAPDDDDDGDDAELASYFPRIKLHMRPFRQRRFVPKHAKFIPIQDDSSEEDS
mmetsp:Transcript_25704/g.39479  ORF Transcript_25704/g.39479 Transcript_25704/m.39479 type:complete len:219 (-) Transcript_25704:194-850(-)